MRTTPNDETMASSNPPRQEEAEAVRAKKTSVTSASPIAVAQEDVGEKFDKLRHGLQELQAAFDREREAVDADKLQNPGHGAHNFGQPILPLGELKRTIEDTMYTTLYTWIEHFSHYEDYARIPHLVLPRLFEECFREATERYQLIHSILFPRGGKTDRTLLHDHMRNNHEALFLLTPSKEHDTALQAIFHNLRSFLFSHPDRSCTERDLDWVMNETGLVDVARKYRKIMVHVSLQEPPVTFSNDCSMHVEGVPVEKKKSLLGRILILPASAPSRGAPAATLKVEPFDPKRHSTPVDAMDIGDGDSCIVVFPAMEVDGKRITRSYTLGLEHTAELPPEVKGEPAAAAATAAAAGHNTTQQQSSQQMHVHVKAVQDVYVDWINTREAQRTVGQLQNLVAVIANMNKTLKGVPDYSMSDAYHAVGLGMNSTLVSSLFREATFLGSTKAPRKMRIIDVNN